MRTEVTSPHGWPIWWVRAPTSLLCGTGTACLLVGLSVSCLYNGRVGGGQVNNLEGSWQISAEVITLFLKRTLTLSGYTAEREGALGSAGSSSLPAERPVHRPRYLFTATTLPSLATLSSYHPWAHSASFPAQALLIPSVSAREQQERVNPRLWSCLVEE